MVVPTTPQPSSDEIAMVPLMREEMASGVPSADEQGDEEHDTSRRFNSISFGRSRSPKGSANMTTREMRPPPRKNSQVPTLAGDHNGIYWPSLAKLIGCFIFGLASCILHHVYYGKRNGTQVLSQEDQQWALRAGTSLAFLASTGLVASVCNAYTQWLWKTLKNNEMSIKAIDAAFVADGSVQAIVNREIWWKMPVGCLIAIVALSIPIVSLITPTTLSVRQGEHYYNTTGNVTLLDMSTVDSSGSVNQPSQFALYVPSSGPTNWSHINASEILTGPRTIISRNSNAAASTGNISPIIPSYPNSTYVLQFYGPKVECQDASPTETAIIDDMIASQSTVAKTNQEFDYFAFVLASNSTNVYPILGDRLEEAVNATNQLWLAYSQYGNGSNCQNPLEITLKHTVCSLQNVSYTVNFTFENGIQNITVVDYQLLGEVDYPITNASVPSNLTQLAYSAYMWAFTDLLTGYMEIYSEVLSNGSAGMNNSQIQTPIQNTALLGSSDLDVFFDQRHLRLDGASNCTLSNQRLQDVGLARNDTLDILIPELSFNITITFFTNDLLSPLVETNITTKSIVNFYSYDPRDLWVSYGLALAFALLANALGGIAFWINGVAHERSFSAGLSATRDPALRKIFNPETLGKAPLPRNVAKIPLIFREMGGEGGLGLKLANTPAGSPGYGPVACEAEDEPAESQTVRRRHATDNNRR